ncbi:hypothetical protein JCM3774_000205 [Rhodotorula dairenensis]
MEQTGSDSALELLPYEIKLAVVVHLLPSPAAGSSSFRHNAAVTAFACASPVLYAELGHLLNADLVVCDRTLADKLVDAAPSRVRDQVRTLSLHGSASDPAQVDALSRSLNKLSELRIHCSHSGTGHRLVSSLRHQTQLRVLEVDFGGGATREPPQSSSPRSSSRAPVAKAAAAATLAPSAASDGSGGCSAQDSSRTSLSLKSRVCPACCSVECCECTSCLVRASLETCPLLAELRLVHALASAPCEPRDRSLSSSMLPYASSVAALHSLCLEDCALAVADLVNFMSPSLRRLELLRCTGVSTTDIVDALKTSQVRLRHFAYEAPPPAAGTPASSPHPAAQLPRSPASSSSTRTPATIGTLLPHLGGVESLTLVGNVLSATEFVSLPQYVPALRRLSITANQAISLEHLADLVTSSAPDRLANLRRLEYEPRREVPLVWCDDGAAPRSSASGASGAASHAVEVLWKASLALDLALVGSPFCDLQDRFSWATGAVEKVRSRVEEEGGAIGGNHKAKETRRKRPSLARET